MSASIHIRTLVGFVCLAVLQASGQAAHVVVVSGGSSAALQTAIDNATEGDTILVSGGPYGSCRINGKSLTVIADPAGSVFVTGYSGSTPSLSISNLSPSQRCTVAGIVVQSGAFTAGNRIENCAGSVRLEAIEITMGPGSQDALTVVNSQDVALVRCMLTGGEGAGSACCGGHAGSDALTCLDSQIALYDVHLAGAAGEDTFLAFGQSTPAGAGGAGARIQSGCTVLASGSTFLGGAGGQGSGGGCYLSNCLHGVVGGAGGHALRITSPSAVYLLDDTLTGGPGGAGGVTMGPCCTPGTVPDGPDGSSAADNAILLPGESVVLVAPTHIREQTNLALEIAGTPGDLAWISLANDPLWVLDLTHSGVLVQGPVARRLVLGTIPAGGTLQASLTFGALPGGVESQLLYFQALTRSSAGAITIGSPAVLTVLDASF